MSTQDTLTDHQTDTATAQQAPSPTQQATVRKPSYTVQDDESGVRLQVALPGVRKDDLKVSVKQSVLQLEARRNHQVPEGWKSHSGPDADLTYQLNLRLPQKLDGDQIKAALANGILTLEIPIKEEAKPREIQIS